jgi:opacity protein-like surface antigen
MKRGLTQACGLVLIPLLLLALPRPGDAAIVGFKFFGGYNSMNGGDINEGLKGLFDIYKAEASWAGLTSHGDYKPFHGGMDLGGDLIIYFSPIVGIGIGASYLQAQNSSELTIAATGGSVTLKIKPEVAAIPIRAGLYFAVPMGSFVNLSINAGAEYYLARIKYRERLDYAGAWEQAEANVDSKGKIGFCGGLGLEIKIHPNLSILLEGRGRYARVDGFEGNISDTSSYGPPSTDSGKLYFLRLNAGPPLGSFPLLTVTDTPPPPDPTILENHLARLDINGFSALAGIMLRF